MKRFTTLLLIAACAGLLALPQPADAAVQFGIKAGANMAKPTGADAQDPLATLKSKVGFTGGIFLAFNFGRVVTIQSEVLYTMKGATYEALDDTYTDKLYADYIEIPLLLKLRIPTPVVQPFVFAGPTVGFKLKEKLGVQRRGDAARGVHPEEQRLRRHLRGRTERGAELHGRRPLQPGPAEGHLHVRGRHRTGLQERRLVGQHRHRVLIRPITP
ncbi:MAG: PorT family protein [Ignavibacteriales bacterium]|nr:PorT family protein [Ignavibacteriales bacterium]